MWTREERGAEAYLKIRERAIENFDGKEALVRPALDEREPGARLDRDLLVSDGIGVLEANRSALVEVLVIDGLGHSGRRGDDPKPNGNDCRAHVRLPFSACGQGWVRAALVVAGR